MGADAMMMVSISGLTKNAHCMGPHCMGPVTNKTIKYNSRPTYTVETLVEFLSELEGELALSRQTVTKAERIRRFVLNLSGFLGERRLSLDAVLDLASERVPDLGRGYFTNIVRKSWAVENDEHGVEWIRVDRPKGRWHK